MLNPNRKDRIKRRNKTTKEIEIESKDPREGQELKRRKLETQYSLINHQLS